jgi:hypothetical protein
VCGALAVGCSQPDPYQEPEPSRGPVPPETSTNYALSFDGVDDYVTTATSGFPFSEVSQTFAAWIKIASTEGQHAILTMRRVQESGTQFGLEDGRLVSYNVYGMRAFVESEDTLAVDQWQHVVYAQEATGSSESENYTQRLYVDGALVATGNLPPQNRTPVVAFIGAFDSRRSLFAGELDDLRVWARILSDEEIQSLAADGNVSNDQLVAHWSFNETPGQSAAYDRSALKNHALLGDGAKEFMPRRVASNR